MITIGGSSFSKNSSVSPCQHRVLVPTSVAVRGTQTEFRTTQAGAALVGAKCSLLFDRKRSVWLDSTTPHTQQAHSLLTRSLALQGGSGCCLRWRLYKVVGQMPRASGPWSTTLHRRWAGARRAQIAALIACVCDRVHGTARW